MTFPVSVSVSIPVAITLLFLAFGAARVLFAASAVCVGGAHGF